MFCNQCGQAISQGSRFCNNCGASVTARGGYAVERNPGAATEAPFSSAPHAGAASAPAGFADEQVIFSIRPTLIFVLVWYIIAIVLLIAVSALTGLLHSWWPAIITGWVSFFIILAAGLLAFAIPIYKHILRRREVYTLTDHKLEMRYGLIAKKTQNIPLRNIQEVTVSASVMQRLARLGDIVIESASETGKITLNEVHNPDRYAGMILSELRRRN